MTINNHPPRRLTAKLLRNKRYFKVPNELVDDHLPSLSGSEAKVLLAVLRFTIGWQKSCATLSNTFIAKAAGISKNSASKVLNELEEKGFIRSISTSHLGTYYEATLALEPLSNAPSDLGQRNLQEHTKNRDRVSRNLGPNKERRKDIFHSRNESSITDSSGATDIPGNTEHRAEAMVFPTAAGQLSLIDKALNSLYVPATTSTEHSPNGYSQGVTHEGGRVPAPYHTQLQVIRDYWVHLFGDSQTPSDATLGTLIKSFGGADGIGSESLVRAMMGLSGKPLEGGPIKMLFSIAKKSKQSVDLVDARRYPEYIAPPPNQRSPEEALIGGLVIFEDLSEEEATRRLIEEGKLTPEGQATPFGIESLRAELSKRG